MPSPASMSFFIPAPSTGPRWDATCRHWRSRRSSFRPSARRGADAFPDAATGDRSGPPSGLLRPRGAKVAYQPHGGRGRQWRSCRSTFRHGAIVDADRHPFISTGAHAGLHFGCGPGGSSQGAHAVATGDSAGPHSGNVPYACDGVTDPGRHRRSCWSSFRLHAPPASARGGRTSLPAGPHSGNLPLVVLMAAVGSLPI